MGPDHKSPQWLRYILAGTAATIVLVACAGLAIPAEPIIGLSPAGGGPGTRVVVTGTGFPAQTSLAVRLGPPDVGATPQTYGEVTSDSSGSFRLVFEMPCQWPDGSPVVEREITVVVLNDDGSVKAVAPFSYRPLILPSPTRPENP